MKDFNETRGQVLDYLGDFWPDFDDSAITSDVRAISDDIDDLDADDFADIIDRHCYGLGLHFLGDDLGEIQSADGWSIISGDGGDGDGIYSFASEIDGELFNVSLNTYSLDEARTRAVELAAKLESGWRPLDWMR